MGGGRGKVAQESVRAPPRPPEALARHTHVTTPPCRNAIDQNPNVKPPPLTMEQRTRDEQPFRQCFGTPEAWKESSKAIQCFVCFTPRFGPVTQRRSVCETGSDHRSACCANSACGRCLHNHRLSRSTATHEHMPSRLGASLCDAGVLWAPRSPTPRGGCPRSAPRTRHVLDGYAGPPASRMRQGTQKTNERHGATDLELGRPRRTSVLCPGLCGGRPEDTAVYWGVQSRLHLAMLRIHKTPKSMAVAGSHNLSFAASGPRTPGWPRPSKSFQGLPRLFQALHVQGLPRAPRTFQRLPWPADSFRGLPRPCEGC